MKKVTFRKATLGKQGSGASSGAQSSGGSTIGPILPGAFPLPIVPPCPSGFLAAPSVTGPGYVCVRAPGSYIVPTYVAGRR